jgi:potassium efflux system protein
LLAWLALLALQGFVLTAGVMLNALWLSISAMLGVAVLRGMLGRWMLLGERRLALRRLEQKREADATGSSDRSGASGDAMPEAELEVVAIENISAQTNRLLRALTIALLTIGLLWVWSDVLPALARLDDIQLWTSTTLDADGNTVPEAVTLRALLFGLACLTLTVVAARNLPGLVEIGLLSRIKVDAPTRYAIASISRYAIVISGVVVGLGLLGVRWSQLQWMAAALTVGLGFGLQEIFANFVSGLIVLFERPYRVGDIITIGEVEGTVTRIRTRATTVLDWNNKEVVVPNRTFITERFVNWTLSDAVTRVVLNVGVSYASDPAQVRDLLLRIADDESLVIKQPGPTCWFVELGDSALNFELRVFVAEILDRNRARNALLQRIVSEFRKREIEIAFPQMDLWVRDLPQASKRNPKSDAPPVDLA